MRKTIAGVVIAWCALMWSATAQQTSPPAPPLSNQLRPNDTPPDTSEQPKKKAKHVYTNEDLPHSPLDDPPAKSKSDKPSDSADAGVKVAPPAPGPDKQADASPSKTEVLQKKVETEQNNLSFLQGLLDKTMTEINDPKTSDFKRQTLQEKELGIRQSIRDVNDRIDQANQDLAAAQKNQGQKNPPPDNKPPQP